MDRNKERAQAQVIIPTLNAEKNIRNLLDSIKMQQDVDVQILILDSESDDKTKEIAEKYQCQIKNIKRKEFNHGGTRQLGVELCKNAEIIVFLTQDTILANEYSLKNILECFVHEDVGCAYGRQLPHKNAGVLASHARLFNYPDKSQVKSIKDVKKLGIKTAFISNSFAAYRKTALEKVGGFPQHTILSEDTYVAAKMILNGWKNCYCAEATVYHSHDYTVLQEFKRYFDIGVFHGKEKWIREEFGNAEGEGIQYLISELKYVFISQRIFLIVSLLTRNMFKYLGYALGKDEKKLPMLIKKRISMNEKFW